MWRGARPGMPAFRSSMSTKFGGQDELVVRRASFILNTDLTFAISLPSSRDEVATFVFARHRRRPGAPRAAPSPTRTVSGRLIPPVGVGGKWLRVFWLWEVCGCIPTTRSPRTISQQMTR